MQNEWNENIVFRGQRQEWWGKITDGIMAPACLCLAWMLVMITVRPIGQVLGTPGLLVYALSLLAVAMLVLQQALQYSYSETRRAWYGIGGGFFAWASAMVSARITTPSVFNLSSLIMLIMAALIVVLLWNRYLPVGLRFFSLTFLFNSAAAILTDLQGWLSGVSPVFTLIYRTAGFLAILAALFMVIWMVAQSRTRIQRVRGALAVWLLLSLAASIFLGSLF